MENEELNKLINSLSEYSDKTTDLQNAKFSTKEVKHFKKYYNSTLIQLIDYIKATKNKNLSNQAKKVKLSVEIFKKTNNLLGILAMLMVVSIILLVYLYFASVANWVIISATTIVGITMFVLIRKIQAQPQSLTNDMADNGKEIKKLITLLKTQH